MIADRASDPRRGHDATPTRAEEHQLSTKIKLSYVALGLGPRSLNLDPQMNGVGQRRLNEESAS
jgi:hypothetical protein